MILAPNRLLLLNGNKGLACIIGLLLFLAACSPKVVPVKPASVPSTPEVEKKPENKPAIKVRNHSIALLLPFELNKFNPQTAGQKEINRSAFALDFYQGFKLALDSLVAKSGHHFKLQVLDTRDQAARVVSLGRMASVRQNDLFVGPVFPSDIKLFSASANPDSAKLQVSPLAASSPSDFKYPYLVTINNSIDQHAWKVADFIDRKYRPEMVNIILINTGKTEDEKFAAPLRKYINELGKAKFLITERPNAIDIQTYIKPGKNNLVIITSAERSFIVPTIDRLEKTRTEGYEIEVFGHPNWVKADFLDVSKLQALKTKLSASYFVNYKAENVKQFVARYRAEYDLEPSEYSIKGFDTGYFFGHLLEKHGKAYIMHLDNEKYKGLHNEFRFHHDPELGYINDELMMLTYRSLELQPVE